MDRVSDIFWVPTKHMDMETEHEHEDTKIIKKRDTRTLIIPMWCLYAIRIKKKSND